MAAQLTSIKAPSARRLWACNARATSSLPEPLSPKNQNAAVGWGHQGQLLPQSLDLNALADDVVAGRQLRPQVGILRQQTAVLESVLDGNRDFFKRQRLLEKIQSAELRGPDRRFNRSVTGDHHHHRALRDVQSPNTLQRFQPVDRGQPNVEQHDLVVLGLQAAQTFVAGFDGVDLIPLVFENPASDSRIPISSSTTRTRFRIKPLRRRERPRGSPRSALR